MESASLLCPNLVRMSMRQNVCKWSYYLLHGTCLRPYVSLSASVNSTCLRMVLLLTSLPCWNYISIAPLLKRMSQDTSLHVPSDIIWMASDLHHMYLMWSHLTPGHLSRMYSITPCPDKEIQSAMLLIISLGTRQRVWDLTRSITTWRHWIVMTQSQSRAFVDGQAIRMERRAAQEREQISVKESLGWMMRDRAMRTTVWSNEASVRSRIGWRTITSRDSKQSPHGWITIDSSVLWRQVASDALIEGSRRQDEGLVDEGMICYNCDCLCLPFKIDSRLIPTKAGSLSRIHDLDKDKTLISGDTLRSRSTSLFLKFNLSGCSSSCINV